MWICKSRTSKHTNKNTCWLLPQRSHLCLWIRCVHTGGEIHLHLGSSPLLETGRWGKRYLHRPELRGDDPYFKEAQTATTVNMKAERSFDVFKCLLNYIRAETGGGDISREGAARKQSLQGKEQAKQNLLPPHTLKSATKALHRWYLQDGNPKGKAVLLAINA